MKAKLNFKSKRTIIIIAIIAIMAIVAGVAGYFYMKSDDTVGATNTGENSPTTSTQNVESQNNGDNNGQDATSTGSNEQTMADGANNDGQQTGTTGETGTNGDTTGAQGTNAPTTGNGTQGTNNGTAGTTTTAAQNGTTAGNANVGTDADTIYEQVTENIVTEQPWETHDVKWVPEQLKVSTAGVEVNQKNIIVNKEVTSTTSGYNAVSVGDEITYTITVTNNDSKVLNSLYITDEIPDETVFSSIDEKGTTVTDSEGNVIKVVWDLWNLGLAEGESTTVSFVVKVKENAEGTISNTALAEGNKSNITENPILKSIKTHKITRGEDKTVKDAKVGDKITYTINVTNTGNVEGTTIVKDTQLKTLVDSKILEINEDSTKIAEALMGDGIEVTLAKGESKDIVFSVTVKTITGAIENYAVVGDKSTNTDTIDTIDWSINKTSRLEEINGNTQDGKAEKGDKIYYTVTVTNNGSIELKDLVITDKMLGYTTKNGTELKITVPIGETVKAIDEEYVVKQEDIDAQKEIKNTVVGKYDDEEKTDTDDGEEVVDRTYGLEVTKLVNGKETTQVKAKVGDELKYSVKVKNTGNTTLTKVTITDEKLKINKVDYTVNLLPNTETTIELGTYKVEQKDVDAQTNIINTVIVNDGNSDTSDDVETPVVDRTYGLEVTKLVNGKENVECQEKAKVGDVLTYSVKVRNTGNTTLTKVTITDERLNINKVDYTVNLVPNAETTIELGTYKVKQEDVNAQTNIINTVIVNDGNKDTSDDVETPVLPMNVTVRKQSIASSSTTEETTTNDVDVVFILDVSGSMEQNNMTGTKTKRAKAMVDATNSAITQIMKNPNNRISVVMYSGDVNSQPELSLSKSYTPKSKTSDGVGEYLKYSDGKIKTNVNQKFKQSSKDVEGATYTQLGIAKGANVLINATETSNRTPVIILLTDGEPTYGTTNYNNVTSTYNIGQGNTTRMSNEEIGAAGYLTILTANYYKNLVSQNYTASPLMYTIGIGMSGIYCETILDPSKENVNQCQNSTTEGASDLYKYLKGNKTAVPLKAGGKTNVSNPYENYDYADGSWAGAMDEDTLREKLESITESITVTYVSTETKTSTFVEAPVIVLEELDTSKSITITLDGVAIPYEVSKLIEDGVVFEPTDGTSDYTMDLTAELFKNAKVIEIEYYSTATIETGIATASLFSLAIEKVNEGSADQVLTMLKENNEETENSKNNTIKSTKNSNTVSKENKLPEKDVENETEIKENVDENTNTAGGETDTDVDNTTEITDNNTISSDTDIVENTTTNEIQQNNDAMDSKEVLDTDSNNEE